MKRLLYLILFTLLLITNFYSCDNQEELSPGSIYGVVTDKATGEPVKSAGVELLSLGTKTITGEEGQFEFQEMQAGKYTIHITKTGYAEFVSASITVTNGKTTKYDVQIDKLPPALRILDDKGTDITSIDFGEAESDVARSFNIFNDSPEALKWKIITTAEWIKSVSETGGELKAGGTQAIVLIIDRTKLTSGKNVTTMHITSDNGSKQLSIIASNSKKLPSLNVYEATSVRKSSAELNGEITDVGNPTYTERGFVYSTSSMPTQETTIAKITYPVSSTTKYTATITGLTNGITYFVRAYAKNLGGVAYSSNEISFTPSSILPTVTTENFTNRSISNGTVTVNATITDQGDPEYTERGFVYGLTHNPNVEDDTKKTVYGKGLGAYSSNLTNLEMGNIYYIRGYAANEQGTAYGEEVTIDFTPQMPEIQTLDVSDLEPTSVRFNGDILSTGDPAFTEKGFVYGTMPTPTLDDPSAMTVTVQGTTTGKYFVSVANLTTETEYYVRAYAKTTEGIRYGEIKTFTPKNPLVVVVKEMNLMVQKEDLGSFSWNDGDRACKNSIVGGYTDWRLPTLEELQGIYLLRNVIGGFSGTKYWSSSYHTHNYYGDMYSYIIFSYGSSGNDYDSSTYRVRAVRTITE